MQRLTLSNATRRLYSSSTVRLAEAAAATSSKQLVLNLVSPHTTVYSGKVVEGVRIPGELGEYGITAGHSPVISQLKPGLVTVNHVGGAVEKYFVPGGFALTHANSVTDISVPEVYPLSDFDETAVKTLYADAMKASGSADPVTKATADIQLSVYTTIARYLNISL